MPLIYKVLIILLVIETGVTVFADNGDLMRLNDYQQRIEALENAQAIITK